MAQQSSSRRRYSRRWERRDRGGWSLRAGPYAQRRKREVVLALQQQRHWRESPRDRLLRQWARPCASERRELCQAQGRERRALCHATDHSGWLEWRAPQPPGANNRLAWRRRPRVRLKDDSWLAHGGVVSGVSAIRLASRVVPGKAMQSLDARKAVFSTKPASKQ